MNFTTNFHVASQEEAFNKLDQSDTPLPVRNLIFAEIGKLKPKTVESSIIVRANGDSTPRTSKLSIEVSLSAPLASPPESKS